MDKSCTKVVMIGPPPEGRGGMSSVVAAYRENGLFERCSVTYVSPVADGSIPVKILAAVRALFRFGGMLVRGQVHLVHIHVASGVSFWRKAMFAGLAYSFRRPVILHLHSGGFVRFSEDRSRLGKRFIMAVFRRACRVIILSRSWLDSLHWVLLAERCVVIDNPVVPPLSTAPVRGHGSAVRFIFLGRLETAKGAYELLEAFGRLSAEYPEASLVMGGTGDLERCERICEQLDVRHKVIFPGWVVGDEKAQLLRESDVFVLPSHIEGMPISMLEAMSFSLPIVICPVGSIPDAVSDGEEAIFVSPGNVSGLTDAMLKLAGNPELRRAMGARAQDKFMRRFSVEVVAARVEALYRSVLDENA